MVQCFDTGAVIVAGFSIASQLLRPLLHQANAFSGLTWCRTVSPDQLHHILTKDLTKAWHLEPGVGRN